MNIMKNKRFLLPGYLIVTLSFAHIACAQNVNVEDLRKKLSALKDTATDAELGEVRTDLEKTNAELLKAEEALLKQVEDLEASEPTIAALDAVFEPSKPDNTIPIVKAEPAKATFSTIIPTTTKADTNRSSDTDVDSAFKAIMLNREEKTAKGGNINSASPEDIVSLRQEVQKLKLDLEQKEKMLTVSDRQLTSVSSNLKSTSGELAKVRAKLTLAETEVSSLSKISAGGGAVKARYMKPKTINTKVSGAALSRTPRITPPQRGRARPVTTTQQIVRVVPEKSPDMPVATVTAEKAFLRTGPGKDNSPLMSVGQGTKLVVETRAGEWFRVITPTGTRAWVVSEVLAFSPDYSSRPTSTVRIRAYDSTIDDTFKITREEIN